MSSSEDQKVRLMQKIKVMNIFKAYRFCRLAKEKRSCSFRMALQSRFT